VAKATKSCAAPVKGLLASPLHSSARGALFCAAAAAGAQPGECLLRILSESLDSPL